MSNKPKKRQKTLGSKDNAQKLLDIIVASLDEDKAEDIVKIDLEGKTEFAYYMVVASGRSSKHVSSLAEKLIDKLVKAGVHGINAEGLQKGDWVLVDAHDIVINIFRPEIREIYDIEKIWGFTIDARDKHN